MKLARLILESLVPAILVAGFATAAVALAQSSEPVAQVAVVRAPRAVAPGPVLTDAPLPADVADLRGYVLGVMQSWPPAPPELPAVDYEDVALDIARAALSDGMPRFEGDPHGAKSALLDAGLGYFEGARYAAYVDDGHCNDPVWRASPEGRWMMARWGDCDHGVAASLWQIHPGKLWLGGCGGFASPEDVTAAKLHDRYYAARIALCIGYRSMAGSGSLAGYTGESSESCPKADLRLDFVLRAIDKHPWPGK